MGWRSCCSCSAVKIFVLSAIALPPLQIFRAEAQKLLKATGKEIKTMRTKCMGPDDMITSLSGGNQQKVIFGKWLEREPQIFMMDEPRRGSRWT